MQKQREALIKVNFINWPLILGKPNLIQLIIYNLVTIKSSTKSLKRMQLIPNGEWLINSKASVIFRLTKKSRRL